MEKITPHLILQTNLQKSLQYFLSTNMRSLYAKLQLFGFKTKGEVWGDRQMDDMPLT